MKFTLFLLAALLMGCQQTPEQLVTENSTEKKITTKINCLKSTTPPIKSTEKIKAMLLANGKIDSSLSDEDMNKAVKAYIRKKNSAFKNCKK